MNGLPYYPRYPRDFFDGTNGMAFELKGAYSMLLDLIYMSGGQLHDEPRFIAGHMNCSVRAWNGYRSALIAMGKISVQNGIISNFRADKELIIQRSFQDKQRENGSKPKKNKDLGESVAKPKASHTDIDTDKERTVAKATDSEAVADPAKAVWKVGLEALSAHGVPESRARTMIGKWRKEHPGKDADILTAIIDCGREGIVDPIPWIQARLTPKPPERFFDFSAYGATPQ